MSTVARNSRIARRLGIAVAVFAFALSPSVQSRTHVPQGLGVAAVVPQASAGPTAAIPTLGCCRCLRGTNLLDLSTIATVPWTVAAGAASPIPAVVVPTPNPYWNLPTSGAQWVSASTAGASWLPGGTYVYRLQFYVPRCTIPQTVRLTGVAGADDDFNLYIDSNPTPVSSCSGGWCFNTSNPTPPFTVNGIGPGLHTLTMSVVNGSAGPTGMFVSAVLEGTCTDAAAIPEAGVPSEN